MSDYTKITDFAAKDALLTGNPSKLVKGTELGAELDAISTAIGTKFDATDLGSTVQAYDAGLASIAGLTTSADKLIYTSASDTYAVTSLTAAGRALLDDASAGDQLTTLGVSAFAKTILDDADEATFKATVNLEPGVDVQAYDADIPTTAASQAEMEAGTETALRSMSPANVRQAISYFGSAYSCSLNPCVAANLTMSLSAIEFQSEQWDDLDWHSNSTNPSRITVSVAGRYRVMGQIAVQAPTADVRAYIYKNGAATYLETTFDGDTVSGYSIGQVSGILVLAANDYVELYAHCSSTVGLQTLRTFFQIDRVS